IAALVNYACHPTSVGGGNQLVTSDYIGAMRELVEREIGGDALCLSLQGASGELAPRRCFEDDVAAADQNGRELGYAAMATLASMMPPGHRLAFVGREESGTALGRWAERPAEGSGALTVREETVTLETVDMPSSAEIRAALADAPGGFQRERLQRKLAMREKIGEGGSADVAIVVWRIGDAVLFGAPIELYSAFQIALRRRFADRAVVVIITTT
ncbi:MAG: hypothetical protein AAFX58_15715, partial [Pseudomonadota bacterium]